MKFKIELIEIVLGLLYNVYLTNGSYSKTERPNIVIILADDLGFNDVSFHGSDQIFTPNIDALAYNGVILNRYYVPALCTPSRASLLTGRYPIHTGMQEFVIPSDEPWGLPLDEVTMPEIFREAGYRTNIVGKWHLGFHKKAFTPTLRGFEYHYGYLGPYIDYWDHSLIMLDRNYSRGYDMRRNLSMSYENNGTYATDLFNDETVRVIHNHDKSHPLFLYVSHLTPHTANEDVPMQAPDDEIAKHTHISDLKRRTYAAMISRLDDGVGKIVQALSDKKMLDNTIILFYADNGGPTLGLHSNSGSNFPFRGQKNSPWEGGVRSAGLIWSPLLQNQRRVSNQLIYATDWLPTLAAAAGIKLKTSLKQKLDGLDLWYEISRGIPSTRRNVLHNIDDSVPYSSYMRDYWKFVNGSTVNGVYDKWLGDIPDEKNPKTLKYADNILESPVAKVLNNFVPKTVTNPVKANVSPLDVQKIQKMREAATVRCEKLEYLPEMSTYECNPLKAPCLFNLETDPCEYYNLASVYPETIIELSSEVEKLRATARKPARVPRDPACDPALHNYTWTWWQDDDNINNNLEFTIRQSQGFNAYDHKV